MLSQLSYGPTRMRPHDGDALGIIGGEGRRRHLVEGLKCEPIQGFGDDFESTERGDKVDAGDVRTHGLE